MELNVTSHRRHSAEASLTGNTVVISSGLTYRFLLLSQLTGLLTLAQLLTV